MNEVGIIMSVIIGGVLLWFLGTMIWIWYDRWQERKSIRLFTETWGKGMKELKMTQKLCDAIVDIKGDRSRDWKDLVDYSKAGGDFRLELIARAIEENKKK